MRLIESTPKRRGFLLIDVMIAGAIAAVVIAGILTVIASARSANVAAARDVIAAQLVLEKIDQMRSEPFAALTTGTFSTENPVAGATGRYQRVVTVSGIVTDTVVSGTSSNALSGRNITVTVTYVSDAANIANNTTRTSAATTRVYQ